MPALPDHYLHNKLLAALPAGTVVTTPDHRIHPFEATVPGLGRLRAYVWTVTADRSARGARPAGEYKIQLILDDQSRGVRGSLDTRGAYTLLLGYSPDFGVFVAWQADRYGDFAYSRNVQVRDDLLAEARNNGWAVAQTRELQSGPEVRVAFSAGNLMHLARTARRADARGLQGQAREAFFLARTPSFKSDPPPTTPTKLREFVARERQRLIATRASRDSRFAPAVKEEFGHSCAICMIQLGIVEAAHIIPANEPGGKDEVWNGLSLCPNHHRLFDANRLVIGSDLIVRLDHDAITFLRESGRDSGVEMLTDHEGRTITAPAFWARRPDVRDRMARALDQRAGRAVA